MDHGGNVNQRHEVDAIDFAIIIGVVGTGGYIWQRYNNPEAIVMAVMLALFMFIMRYSVTFWSILAYIYENVSNEDVGYVAHGSLAADVLPGIARALPQERPVKSFVASRQPLLLPPPQNVTPPVTRSENVTAPHIKRELVDTLEERNGARVTLRKEIVTRPDGKVVELPREVTPVTLPEFDFGEDVTPIVTGPALLSSEALLKALDEKIHVGIIGETNSGKTTLLRHLCENHSKKHTVLVIDPHAAPDSWPSRVRVVGAGCQYDRISAALAWIIGEMDRRYKEISEGTKKEGEHARIYLVSDEWFAVVQQIPEAGPILSRLVCEARKSNIRIILGAHSPFLRGLGISDSAVRLSLKMCHLNIENGRRWARIGTLNYALPAPASGGTYHTSTPVHQRQTGDIPLVVHENEGNTALADDANLPSDAISKMIRRMVSKKMSYNQICEIIGGSKTTALEKIHYAVGKNK